MTYGNQTEPYKSSYKFATGERYFLIASEKCHFKEKDFQETFLSLSFFFMFASSTSISRTVRQVFSPSLLTVLSPTPVHMLEKNSSVLAHILDPWTASTSRTSGRANLAANVHARSTFNRTIRALPIRPATDHQAARGQLT